MEQLRKLDRDLAWKNKVLLPDKVPSMQSKLGIIPRRQPTTSTLELEVDKKEEEIGTMVELGQDRMVIPPPLASRPIHMFPLELNLPAKPSRDVISASYRPRSPPTPPLSYRKWQDLTSQQWSSNGDNRTRQHIHPESNSPQNASNRNRIIHLQDFWRSSSSTSEPHSDPPYSSSSRSSSGSSSNTSFSDRSSPNEPNYTKPYHTNVNVDSKVDSLESASTHGFKLRYIPPIEPKALRNSESFLIHSYTDAQTGHIEVTRVKSSETPTLSCGTNDGGRRPSDDQNQTLEVTVVDKSNSMGKKRPRTEDAQDLPITKSKNLKSPLITKSKWKKLETTSSSFKTSIPLKPSLDGSGSGSDSGSAGERGLEKELERQLHPLQGSQPSSLDTAGILPSSQARAKTPTTNIQLEEPAFTAISLSPKDDNGQKDVSDTKIDDTSSMNRSMFRPYSLSEHQEADRDTSTYIEEPMRHQRDANFDLSSSPNKGLSPTLAFDDSFLDDLIDLKVIERTLEIQQSIDQLEELSEQLKRDIAELSRAKQSLELELGKTKSCFDIATRSNQNEREKSVADIESLRLRLKLAQEQLEVHQDRITELELYGTDDQQQRFTTLKEDMNAKIRELESEKQLLCRDNKDLGHMEVILKRRVDELELSARSADAFNTGLLDSLNRKTQEIDGLEVSLGQRSKLMDQLSSDNYQMKNDIEAKNQEINGLKLRMKFVCGQREKNGDDLENEQKINQRLKIDLDKKSNECQIVYTELERLEEDKSQLEKKSENENKTIKTQIGVIKDLQVDLEKSTNDIRKSKADVCRLENENEALRKSNADKDRQLSEMESCIAKLKDSLSNARKDREDITNVKEELATCIQRFSKERHRIQKRHNELLEERDAQLKQRTDSINGLGRKVKTLEKDFETKEEELTKVKERLSIAEEKAIEHEKQHVLNRREVCRLIIENSKLTKSTNLIEDERKSHKESLEDMRSHIARHVSDKTKLKEENIGYKIYEAFMSGTNKVIKDLGEERDRLKEEVERLASRTRSSGIAFDEN